MEKVMSVDPIYQNVPPFRPVAHPRHELSKPGIPALYSVSQNMLHQGDKCVNKQVKFTHHEYEENSQRPSGQSSCSSRCADDSRSCNGLCQSSEDCRLPLKQNYAKHQSDESDASDCDEPEYEFPPPSSAREKPTQQKGPCKIVTFSGSGSIALPPIPPKAVQMSDAQKELFNRIPPSPSVSPAVAVGYRSLAPDHSSKSKTLPSRDLRLLNRSASPALVLTDSVPPCRLPVADVGYVPHKPFLEVDFPVPEKDGYLRMTKQSFDEIDQDKPPFEDLWSQENDRVNDHIDENDPEYFSMSDLYSDEPLYQVYHKEAVVRDVLEQALEDDVEEVLYEDYETILMTVLKRTSDKRQMEMGKRSMIINIENLIPSAPGLRRFWSDTPQVKQSGMLDRLLSHERKHQECLFEIITSEASYLKSLKLLETHFMESPLLKPPTSAILSKKDYQHLFSNVKSIIAVSNRMLQELELVWKRSVVLDARAICLRMKIIAERRFEVYVPYLKNAVFQERKLSELRAKPGFLNILTELEDSPVVNGLKLQSFIVLPMQRITRIPLLIDAVLNGISSDDPATGDIKACLNVFQQLLKECNEKARQLENLEQLNDLGSQLKFKKVKTVPIVSQTRSVVKKGNLTLLRPVPKSRPHKTVKNLLKTVQNKVLKDRSIRHFFLFNDLLLISKKKNNLFEVIQATERRNTVVEAIDESNVLKFLPNGAPHDCGFLFCLGLLDEESTELILSCDSENERMRWMEAFCPSSLDEEDEKIYELNDCPQVQTFQKFIAKQPDELGLEESDIVNVLHKTIDGWYEGERIRDGRRGWFLASHTVEIESAHKRAKNRRQHWRLLRQTQTFQNHCLT